MQSKHHVWKPPHVRKICECSGYFKDQIGLLLEIEIERLIDVCRWSRLEEFDSTWLADWCFCTKGQCNTLFHAGFQGFCYMRALQMQHTLKIGEHVWHVLEHELNCGNHLCPAYFEDAVEWSCTCHLEAAVWEDCFCTLCFLLVILLLFIGSSVQTLWHKCQMNECEFELLKEWRLMGKLKYLEENWTQWHFVPQKSHLNSWGIEPGLFSKKLEAKCLRHVLALHYYGICCSESRRCGCHTLSNVLKNCYTCCDFPSDTVWHKTWEQLLSVLWCTCKSVTEK